MKKLYFFATVIVMTLIQTMIVDASPMLWRSQSGKTQIYNLDNPCYGITDLLDTQTVFGDNLYTGTITMRTFNNYGCASGDTLTGEFFLTHGNSACIGLVTMTWKPNNNVYLKWDISNAGQCNVTTKHWEINTYPVASSSIPTGQGVVFDPPSNVRQTPNGKIICTIRSTTTINLLSYQKEWYQTDFCGGIGYIHQSQIR